MFDADDVFAEKMAWAGTVKDPASRKLWESFFTNFWYTDEGQAHFQRVADRRNAGKKVGDL